jgi:hypothetical protein
MNFTKLPSTVSAKARRFHTAIPQAVWSGLPAALRTRRRDLAGRGERGSMHAPGTAMMTTLCIATVLLLVVTSCTHHYYIPATANVPLFREKDEYRVTGAFGTGKEIGTAELQGAYAITDNFAAMATAMSARGKSESIRYSGSNREVTSSSGTGKYFDAAIDYYSPLGAHGVFEVFGGVGGGDQHHEYKQVSFYSGDSHTFESGGDAYLSFRKIFIQPSIGLTFDGFDAALTCGFTELTFLNVQNRITNDYRESRAVDAISENRFSYLLEPALTVRGGWKHVKMQVQAIYSHNVSHRNLEFVDLKVSLGVAVTYAPRFKETPGTTPTQQSQ